MLTALIFSIPSRMPGGKAQTDTIGQVVRGFQRRARCEVKSV